MPVFPGPDPVIMNNRLNEQEYAAREERLRSTPRAVFLQMDGPCNHDCLFCSRPTAYRFFSLDDYRRRFSAKLDPVIAAAERLNLTGSGELLLLPQARENLTYFNQFVHTEKMFATNGSSLTPKMIDLLAASGNRYVIHVSLHAANAPLHARMAGANTFKAVLANLDYLRSVKATVPGLKVNYIFVATTENIKDLPAFVRFAAEHGADAVIAYYNYVYRLDQKALSCYFAQALTNEMLDQARDAAGHHNLTVHLPPKFRQANYPRETICGEVWSNLMVNPEGDVITCDVAGDSRENINNKSFDDVWNGPYYTRLRSLLRNGNHACSASCFRANPVVVNDFRSHFITRGKSAEEIKRFMEGT